jgi:hypothetical protein
MAVEFAQSAAHLIECDSFGFNLTHSAVRARAGLPLVSRPTPLRVESSSSVRTVVGGAGSRFADAKLPGAVHAGSRGSDGLGQAQERAAGR